MLRWILKLILHPFGLVVLSREELNDMNDAIKLHVTLHNKFVRSAEIEVEQRFLHLLLFMKGQTSTWFYGFNCLPGINLQETATGFAKLKPAAQVDTESKVVELQY